MIVVQEKAHNIVNTYIIHKNCKKCGKAYSKCTCKK